MPLRCRRFSLRGSRWTGWSSPPQAGLVLGQRVFGYSGTLLGISIDEPASALASQVAALASNTSATLGPRINFDADEVHVDDGAITPSWTSVRAGTPARCSGPRSSVKALGLDEHATDHR